MTLLLSACGGDDEGDSGSGGSDTQATTTTQTQAQPETQTQTDAGDSPTREEYIAEADAFCKEANAEAKSLNQRLRDAAQRATPGRGQLGAVVPILEEGYELQRRSRAEFKKIPYPPADREVIEKLHAAYDEQTDLVGRLLEAAKAKDVARFQELSKEQDRVKIEARALTREYGFKECGSGRNEAD